MNKEDIIEDFNKEFVSVDEPSYLYTDIETDKITKWLKQKLSDLEQSTREKTLEEVRKKIDEEMTYCGVLDSNEKRRGYEIAYTEIKNLLTSLQRNDSK